VTTDSSEEIRLLAEQNAQLVALLLASQRLGSTLDPEAVLTTVLDVLVEFTGAAAASIWMRDDVRGALHLKAARGVHSTPTRGIPVGEGIIGGVAATGEEMLDGPADVDPDTGLPIVAAVPLRLQEEVVGVVAIHRLLPQKSRLEEGDRELLRLIAGQAAPALTSARLYTESRSAIRGVHELGQRISASVDDLETVLATTVSAVAPMVRADICLLFLVDEESGNLVLRAASGLDSARIGASLQPGEGLAGRVFASAKTSRLDTVKTGRASLARLASTEGGPLGSVLGSVLAVPLKVGERVIGVLSVGRVAGSSNWESDVEIVLGTAAVQLAIGINNARLYARVEDDYFKMSTLFVAANRLHATLDLREILVSSRDILESLIGARAYSIILLDEEDRELRISVAEGVPPVQRSAFRASLEDDSFLSRVIKSGEPYVAPAGEQPRERLYGQPVLACVPLLVEQVPVGAFVINRLLPQKAGLIAHDNELFAMLVQHAATAILAARLYARAEQRLVTLYDLSRLISASVSAEEIMRITMGLVTQVLRVQVAVLFDLDADTQVLRPSEASGLEPGALGDPVRVGEGPVGQVALSGKPLEAGAAEEHPAFAGAVAYFRGPTMVMPMKVANSVIGVLAVTGSPDREPFGEDDRRLAMTLAGQVGLILHHTSLYQQAQHLAILLEREREALRRANHALEMANRELDTLIEHLVEGMMLADPVGRILRINPAGRELLGLPEAGDILTEFQDLALLEAQTSANIRMTIDEWPIVRATVGETVTGFEVQVTMASGQQRSLMMSAQPVRNPSGEVALGVCIFHDVTEQRAVDRAKEEFLAVASHELKNPMTALRGFAQLMLRRADRGLDQPDLVRGLQTINDQADRVVKLIDRLMDLSRIELGRVQLEREPTDLRALVRRLVAVQRASDTDRPIEIATTANQIEGHWDRARLEQVVENLLSNACKFTPPGTPVQVELQGRSDTASLVVRDRGPGIPEGQIDSIFERYAQGPAGEGSHAGLGLGLYVSRQIVEAHGGRMWAESEPGRGAAFHVTLPLRPEPEYDGREAPEE
jgi:two-component system, OmpR family, phosphate regulon sensor histidine kinase PhoR